MRIQLWRNYWVFGGTIIEFALPVWSINIDFCIPRCCFSFFPLFTVSFLWFVDGVLSGVTWFDDPGVPTSWFPWIPSISPKKTVKKKPHLFFFLYTRVKKVCRSNPANYRCSYPCFHYKPCTKVKRNFTTGCEIPGIFTTLAQKGVKNQNINEFMGCCVCLVCLVWA